MVEGQKVLPWALVLATLVMMLFVGCAASAEQRSAAHPGGDDMVMAESSGDGGVDRADREHRAPPAEASPRGAASQKSDSDGGGRADRLLVYTATVVLAIFDVTATQEQAIETAEARGGYVSRRTSDRLTLRVPAKAFRQTLDELAALGDVLDMNWQAQDVSDEVRDLDIRLRNALELRDRLEVLLDRAETVEDALKIEAELERITLEVERIRGQLQSFEDRIAYSTIDVVFRPRRAHQVPDDHFLLPFHWLNDLGLQSLLRAPRARR